MQKINVSLILVELWLSAAILMSCQQSSYASLFDAGIASHEKAAETYVGQPHLYNHTMPKNPCLP